MLDSVILDRFVWNTRVSQKQKRPTNIEIISKTGRFLDHPV